MSCSRGKASPDRHTQLRLFADSGGFCQNPGCYDNLFVDTGTQNVHIAEIAHIFAASDDGPRPDPNLSEADRGSYKNLILLCPSCHTIIDKASSDFPDVLVTGWKRDHIERIKAAFGAVVYGTRSAARDAIAPTILENYAIFTDYGPDNEYSSNPESELADVWRRKVLSRVLPNNRKILAILDVNRLLLRKDEAITLEHFRQHVEEMEARHLGMGVRAVGRRYPKQMSNMFLEIADDETRQ